MSLAEYADAFRRLNVATRNGQTSPHKICMLLAMLDLARGGALVENRVRFEPALLERYRLYFKAVQRAQDHINPWFPFFHLKGRLRGGTISFWHLQPRPGREAVLATMTKATSAKQITDNIDYAYLDTELFELMQEPTSVDALSAVLAQHWFARGLEDLGAVVEHTKEIGRYERRIRELVVTPQRVSEQTPGYIRDPAFRRVVTQIYDYRCAATGLRLILPDGGAMLEAAHIHPFCEAGDDDPRNGIALTPNMHWALDRNLIAPNPEFRWCVSALLDPRIPDHRVLTELDGKTLFLPRELRLYPKREVLEWKLAQILR